MTRHNSPSSREIHIINHEDGTAMISLPDGRYFLVDSEEVVYINQWRWRLDSGGYVCRSIGNKPGEWHTEFLHRFVLGLDRDDPRRVDHINRDKLDNRKSNLRIAEQAQNVKNCSVRKDNTSGFKGVSWHKRDSVWEVYVREGRKAHYVGRFDDKVAAARAYNEMVTRLHGEFACLNEIPKDD